MKKVILVTAPQIFRDEEYYKPKKVLETAGIKTITASIKTGEIVGKFGYKTMSEVLIENINANDYDAIIYVGGGGAGVFFENSYALNLAKDFFKQGKPTAAICIASVILAKAGILKNKKATVFIDGKEELIKGLAHYTGAPLEMDGNIITANGPDAAEDFGKAVSDMLIADKA
jgi:protease I